MGFIRLLIETKFVSKHRFVYSFLKDFYVFSKTLLKYLKETSIIFQKLSKNKLNVLNLIKGIKLQLDFLTKVFISFYLKIDFI